MSNTTNSITLETFHKLLASKSRGTQLTAGQLSRRREAYLGMGCRVDDGGVMRDGWAETISDDGAWVGVRDHSGRLDEWPVELVSW